MVKIWCSFLKWRSCKWPSYWNIGMSTDSLWYKKDDYCGSLVIEVSLSPIWSRKLWPSASTGSNVFIATGTKMWVSMMAAYFNIFLWLLLLQPNQEVRKFMKDKTLLENPPPWNPFGCFRHLWATPLVLWWLVHRSIWGLASALLT